MNRRSISLPAAIAALLVLSVHPTPAALRDDGQTTVRQIVKEISSENIERTIRKLVSFGTRCTLSSQTDPGRGIGAARDWLHGEMNRIAADSGGRLKVDLQAFEQPVGPRIPKPTRLTNVIAMLPGEKYSPDQRLYVVSGHYDSMPTSPTDPDSDAPGANDDASGVAAVLEMARAMSRYRFDAPILFMAVAGEEQGLLGSAYAAEQAKKAGWRVEGMFTNDIIGGTLGGNGARDDRTLRVFSEGIPSDETPAQANVRRSVGGENDGPSRQLARFIQEASGRFVPGLRIQLIYRRDRYGRGGDHISFLERGFPAVRFTEPNEDYHHQHQNVRVERGVQYGDLSEFVDFPYVAQVARANAAALALLASGPPMPRNAALSTRQSYGTTLSWTEDPSPSIRGYEVVWRSTDESRWTHARFVGRVSTATIEGLSKDNFLFGVRSVDNAGRKSVVSYPRPGR